MKNDAKSKRLDIPKIMIQLEEYENSPSRGGTRIAMPVEQAVKVLAKQRPERKDVRMEPKRRNR